MPVITLVGHNEAVYDVCCNPVEPGILASCGRKGMVAIWDARQTGYLTFSFNITGTSCSTVEPLSLSGQL